MIKVKILSCENPDCWYSDKIGQVFEVEQHNNAMYALTDNKSLAIWKSDCVVIEVGYIEAINVTPKQTNISKSEGKFYIKEDYQDDKNKTQVATILLIIDYLSKQYTIKPLTAEFFSFSRNNHKWKMWKAITKAIDTAIDFANEELKIN